jgi:ribosomal-protein-alanine N-acetyltransferase
MNIKILSKEDINCILELFSSDFEDGWNKNQLSSSFDSGLFLCVGAFDNEKLVGVICASSSIDTADIESVVVKKEFRRKGIASLLINELINLLEKENITKILLEVRESNLKAISLYKKHNFKEISVRKKYYANGENALIFIKE